MLRAYSPNFYTMLLLVHAVCYILLRFVIITAMCGFWVITKCKSAMAATLFSGCLIRMNVHWYLLRKYRNPWYYSLFLNIEDKLDLGLIITIIPALLFLYTMKRPSRCHWLHKRCWLVSSIPFRFPFHQPVLFQNDCFSYVSILKSCWQRRCLAW